MFCRATSRACSLTAIQTIETARRLSTSAYWLSGRFGDTPGSNSGGSRNDYARGGGAARGRGRGGNSDIGRGRGGNSDTGPGNGDRDHYNRSERFAPDGSRKRPSTRTGVARDNNHRSNQGWRDPFQRQDSRDSLSRDLYQRQDTRDSFSRDPFQRQRSRDSFSRQNSRGSNRGQEDRPHARNEGRPLGASRQQDPPPVPSDVLPGEINPLSSSSAILDEYDVGDDTSDFLDVKKRVDRSARKSRTSFDRKRYDEQEEEVEEDAKGLLRRKGSKKGRMPELGSVATSERRERRKPTDLWAEEGAEFEDDEVEFKPMVPKEPKPIKIKKVNKEIFVGSTITALRLTEKLGVKLRALQHVMTEGGYEDVRADVIIKYEDAELLAAEFQATVVAESDTTFDIFRRPPPTPEVFKTLRPRPPIVAIMGHVDHGKTTLLDTLRKTTTAKGEPGGITQHIAAFSVPIQGRLQDKGATKGYKGIQTITFLDTPGHAAFTAMRGRGATLTDIVVLVVAVDDGVMPQTLEVINLVKQSAAKTNPDGSKRDLQLLVALNKTEIIDCDPDRVKRELLAAGVELEEFGGNVPCVEISGKTGKGLQEFEETLAVMAELADLRAEHEGRCEGYVIESEVDKGNGPMATVLVTRGALKKEDPLIAGVAWCKARRILHSNGRPLAQALPGEPVKVSGWRKLPDAGDELFGGRDMIAVKQAVENRKRQLSEAKLLEDATQINEQRRLKHQETVTKKSAEHEARKEKRDARIAAAQGSDALASMTASAEERERQELENKALEDELAAEEAEGKEVKEDKKYLDLIVKGDVSGSVEAVVGAIIGIGNAEAGVRIISQSAGEVTSADVATAAALQGAIVAFNVTPSKNVLGEAANAKPSPIRVIASDVIYRLMDEVKGAVSALLTPTVEIRVQGEATVGQIFDISLKGNRTKKIAGCRINNGYISKSNPIRILRGSERKSIWQGKIDDFKHMKKDVTEMRKGTECGISFDDFHDVRENDVVQSITEITVPRSV